MATRVNSGEGWSAGVVAPVSEHVLPDQSCCLAVPFAQAVVPPRRGEPEDPGSLEQRLANGPVVKKNSLWLTIGVYDGKEQTAADDGEMQETGYLSLQGGERVRLLGRDDEDAVVMEAGHDKNRFGEYVFGVCSTGEKGWVPFALLRSM